MRHWLYNDRIADPVERQQAALLQILLAIMLAAMLMAMLLSAALFGLAALAPAALLPNLLLLLSLAGALAILRRGRVRLAVALIIAALLAGQAYALLTEGLADHAAQLLVFVVPIALAGMLLPRAGLLATIALSLAIAGAAVWADLLRGAARPPPPPSAVLVLFLLVAGVLGLFLDRFSSALRQALADATRLAAENDRLYQEAQAQRAQFHATLASLGDAVIAADPAGQITFMNHMAESLTGWRLDEVAGQPLSRIFTIVDESSRAPVESPAARVLQTGAAAGLANHTLLVARDGRALPIDDSGAPIRDAAGQLLGVVLVFRDISERRVAELALRESEARFRTMADSAPVLIWVSDADALYTYFNQPWLEFTGRALEHELGYGWADGLHPDDHARALEAYRSAFAAREPFTVECRLRRADGSYRWVLDTGLPRWAPGGAFAGYIGSCVDITERVFTERRLTAQYSIARILSEAPTLAEASPQILQTIGETLAWDWGALWMLDRDDGLLRCVEIWHAPGIDAHALSEASWRIRFGYGQGMPGQVWQRGESLWVEDINREANFLRVADTSALGLRGAFAVPIRLGASFLGAFEFFRRSTHPLDDALLSGMTAIGRQIGQFTERIQTESALRASEARYRTLVDAIPQITWVMLPSGELEYLSQRWAEYTGRSLELRHGGRWVEAIHPDDRAELVASRTAALAAGTGYELTVRVQRAGAGYRWNLVRVVPLRDEHGVMAWFGTSTDIDDLKQAEVTQRFLTDASKQLAASLDFEATLQTVLRLAVPRLAGWCAVLLYDDERAVAQLAIDYADPAQAPRLRSWRLRAPLERAAPGEAALALGDDLPARPGALPAELLAAEPELPALYRELQSRPALRVPLVARNRVLGSLELIAEPDGRRYSEGERALAEELARRAATALDNAQLYQSAQQAIGVRDQFLSIASHELKTPLTAMLGYTRLMQRRNERERFLAERDQRAINAIESQGRRLESLINLLLDLSRIETGHLQLDLAPLDLRELIERLVDEIQPTLDRHTIALDLPDQPVIVLADPLRLEQVALNLLQNAIKYSPFGGPVAVRLAQDQDQARLEISDAGIGIPAEVLPRLFSRFYRAPNASELHISGTGIGLYVVREIVTRHGGTVEVASVEREGSTFTVRLPLAS